MADPKKDDMESCPLNVGKKGLPPKMPGKGSPVKGEKDSSPVQMSGYRQYSDAKKAGRGKGVPPYMNE